MLRFLSASASNNNCSEPGREETVTAGPCPQVRMLRGARHAAGPGKGEWREDKHFAPAQAGKQAHAGPILGHWSENMD